MHLFRGNAWVWTQHRHGCKGREIIGSYFSLICFHSSKAIMFIFSLLLAVLISKLCNLGGFEDDRWPFCFPAMCLATAMHGNRDAPELVVSISGCCATLNFSLWEGFGSWAVFNSWDDEEAEGCWWQGPSLDFWVTFELHHGIVRLGLPLTLCLISHKSVGFPVCCVFSVCILLRKRILMRLSVQQPAKRGPDHIRNLCESLSYKHRGKSSGSMREVTFVYHTCCLLLGTNIFTCPKCYNSDFTSHYLEGLMCE